MRVEKLITGKIGRTYKLNGYLHLFTQNSTANLKKEKVLLLKKNDKTWNVEVEDILETGEDKYIKLKNVDTPENAKVFSGSQIFVSRENATPLKEGEVYTADLIGLDVFVKDEKKGVVTAWMEGVGNILLEITTNDGKKHIVPYMKVFLSEPDFINNKIVLLKDDLLS